MVGAMMTSTRRILEDPGASLGLASIGLLATTPISDQLATALGTTNSIFFSLTIVSTSKVSSSYLLLQRREPQTPHCLFVEDKISQSNVSDGALRF